MARRARLSDDENGDEDGRNLPGSMRRSQRRVSLESLSPSPAASFSSDKENRQASAEVSRQSKGKGRTMGPPQMPTPTPGPEEQPRSTKRRKLSERDTPNASQATHAKRLAEAGDTDYYDPEQSIVERRAVRKDFRDLSRELTGRSHTQPELDTVSNRKRRLARGIPYAGIERPNKHIAQSKPALHLCQADFRRDPRLTASSIYSGSFS